jgi:type II secretory pathway component GspD/PulD (secretin)
MRQTAVQRAAVLCALAFLAGCGSDGTAAAVACETLEAGELASSGSATPQVNIEARLVVVSRTFLRDLGVTWPSTAPVQTNDQVGLLGGRSAQGSDVVVDADTVGGPDGVPYLVTDGFDGLLAVVNRNFISPFAGQSTKVFPGLPFPGGCVRCADAATTPIQAFAGGADAGVLVSTDPGLVGTVLHDFLDDAERNSLLDALDLDSAMVLIEPPVIRLRSGQGAVIGIQDVLPQISDLKPSVRTAVQSVVQSPFGMFTGFALDFVPTVNGGNIELTIRPGTELLSAFRSVPAVVGGDPVDVEIPFVSRSTNFTRIVVPDGQTLVLGGLLLQGETEPTTGIPLLGNVPLLGNLFSHQITTPEEQTLVIMITPRIIED